MNHPLNTVFDLEEPLNTFGDIDFEVGENPDFDTIINLSLKMYEQQMAVIEFVEPKNRLKYIEVANSLLNTAKDAMAKKKAHDLAVKKLAQAKKAPKVLLEGQSTTTTADGQTLISRNDLYD